MLNNSVQALLQTASSKGNAEEDPCKGNAEGDPSELSLHVFSHTCVIMSTAPDAMLDPLFVVLLDILARLTQLEPGLNARGQSVISSSLVQGIRLIPKESLRDTLSKKLKSQVPYT